MMKLPEKFQFRAKGEPGFTHAAKIVGGKYKVKWARGFESYFMEKHNLSKFADSGWDKYSVQRQIENDNWVLVVEDKKVEQGLPETFKVKTMGGLFVFEQTSKDEWLCNAVPVDGMSSHWPREEIEYNLEKGVWSFYDTPSLTPEQFRSNAEFREQIAALEQSIKWNLAAIEHSIILSNNYKDRIKDLESKLVKES